MSCDEIKRSYDVTSYLWNRWFQLSKLTRRVVLVDVVKDFY